MTRVLFVDDRPEMRGLVRDALEDDGYLVSESPNAESAFSVLRSSAEPQVVIFGMTVGTTLLQAAVEEPAVRRHAFVLLTATPEYLTPLWHMLLAALDVPVVAKPFRIETLLHAVASAAARITCLDGHPIPA